MSESESLQSPGPIGPPHIAFPSPAELLAIDSNITAHLDNMDPRSAAECMIARMDLLVAPLLARIAALEAERDPDAPTVHICFNDRVKSILAALQSLDLDLHLITSNVAARGSLRKFREDLVIMDILTRDELDSMGSAPTIKAAAIREGAAMDWPKAKITVTEDNYNYDEWITLTVQQGRKRAEGRLHHWMDLRQQREVIARMHEKLKPRPSRPRASRRPWRVGPQRIKPI